MREGQECVECGRLFWPEDPEAAEWVVLAPSGADASQVLVYCPECWNDDDDRREGEML